MGLEGVPFGKTPNDILEGLKRHYGIIRKLALEWGCCRASIYNRLHLIPDIVNILKELRKHHDENLCDSAEGVLERAMEKVEIDINAALKASFYVLNNKGKERGYSKDNYIQQKDAITELNEYAVEKQNS